LNKVKNKQSSSLLRFGIFSIKLLIASAVTFIFASFMHTQAVLSGLVNIGAEIPLSLRIQTVFVDFIGLLPTYGIIVLIGMLIAMPVANLVVKKLNLAVNSKPQKPQILLYAAAGALAMFCILMAMHPILNITVIAGARGWSGLLSQSIAGAIGGIAFALIRPIKSAN
jgi:hypothetical protein